jgi:hypothetical protein
MKQTNDYSPVGFNIACVTFDAADTTLEKLVIAASVEDSTIGQFTIANEGVAAAFVELRLHDGVSSHLLTVLSVPALAGMGDVPVYDVLALAFIYNACLPLKGGWSLYARPRVLLDEVLHFSVFASDY